MGTNEKVFCCNCKYFGGEVNESGYHDGNCQHPTNLKDNWLSPGKIHTCTASLLNKYNDCKNFELEIIV